MSSTNLSTFTIPKKSEAWKFSPKALLSNVQLDLGESSKEQDFLNLPVAIGHTEDQFQTLTWKDLEEDGYLKIEFKPSFKTFKNSDTDRAQLDYSITEQLSHSLNPEIHILKNLPSNLWLTPSYFKANVSFKIAAYTQQNILFFEQDKGENGQGFIINFELGEKAGLELGIHAGSTNTSLSQINFQTQESSILNIFSIFSNNASYKRLETNVFQRGKESKATINGLCFSKETSVFDFYSNVFHMNTDQETHQLYKSICSGKSKSIFGGRIHLTEKASGADVHQLNSNLLLGPKASVDTQPELNIFQDNVKASHGATTSTIDDDHMFYFASRGFKPDQSKRILIEAFCRSSMGNLQNKGFKKYFTKLISQELLSV